MSNTATAALYGNYNVGAFYADGLAGYAYSSNNMVREISFPGIQRTAYGQTGANQFYGLLESGYRVGLGDAWQSYVTPFARLQASTATQNGFAETGAQSLDLTVGAQTTNSLLSTFGAQVDTSVNLGLRDNVALQFKAGWTHEYANTSRPVNAAFVDAPALPFTTYGVSPQRDGALIGFAASTAIAQATSVYVRYEGNFAGLDNTQAFTAGLRMTW
jgi:outer membrane autotransporter protein